MKKISRYTLYIVVSLFAINANSTPMAYSVNSDSGSSNQDSLYEIDLATGNELLKGELISVKEIYDHTDTEGLAFSNVGTLWGMDDDTRTLFQVNTDTGAINIQSVIPINIFPEGGGNDFGMTFSCDNSLYVTSVITHTLYRLDLEGNSEIIGGLGKLGVNISAIAAFGNNPVLLYGLGNGEFLNGETDSPNLYSINVDTGSATMIGPLGDEVGEYAQGGLAFDDDGSLWGITDRRIVNETDVKLPSQIMRINVDTGTATWVSDTNEVGFESLAVAPPAACNSPSNPDSDYPTIPTLNLTGRLLAIFVLLLAGIGILRRHIF